METPDGSTTVGMGFCLEREWRFWDGRLNAAYGALMQLEAAAEEELRSWGSAAPSPAAALKAMQRAWIAVPGRGLRLRGEPVGRRDRGGAGGDRVHDDADRPAGAGAGGAAGVAAGAVRRGGFAAAGNPPVPGGRLRRAYLGQEDGAGWLRRDGVARRAR